MELGGAKSIEKIEIETLFLIILNLSFPTLL